MSSTRDDTQTCDSTSHAASSRPLADFLSVHEEYGSLVSFIKQTSQPLKSQLINFLYPLYVYMYLILLKENKVVEARKFLLLYSKPFLKSQGYEIPIQLLRQSETLKDIQDHSYFKVFCEGKYVIRVSADSLKYLKSYLEETQCKILLSILNFKIDIEDITDKSSVKDSVEKECASKLSLSKSEGILQIPKENASQSNMTNCICNISYGKGSLCAADINRKTKMVSCVFENSAIHLWSLVSDFKRSEETEDSFVKFHLNETQMLSSTLGSDNASKPSSHKVLNGHNELVYGLAFTPDFDYLLSCSKDTTVRVWSMKEYKQVCVYSEHKYPIWDVTVSSDCAYFATASMDMTACLWSFERWIPIRIMTGHTEDVDCVRFHPNCKYLATASSDRTVQLWTIQHGESVRTFSGHNSHISCIAFSPNGKFLTSADADGYIKIWDLASGKEYCEIKAHTKRILSLSYSKSGSFLASGGYDNFLKVWNVEHCNETIVSSSNASGKENYHCNELSGKYSTGSVLHHVSFRKADNFIALGTLI